MKALILPMALAREVKKMLFRSLLWNMTNTSYVYMKACNNFQFHVHVMESFLLAGCCNVSVYEWF